jgi:PAS domain S-box-containing protein
MDITAQLARAILESQADAILVADREGVICFWNPGAARIFGFGAEEAIGHSLDLIIPEPLRARHWEGYKRVMVSGETRYGSGDVLSVPALTKAGLRISVEFTIIILREDNDAVIGMAAILRDVSARFEELRGLRRRLNDLEK